MKIAIVAEAAETHSGSRVEVELAKQLAKIGQEVSFYAHWRLSTPQVKQELEKVGIKVTLVKSPKIKVIGRFIGALALSKALREEYPQIISAHTTLPFAIGAKLSGITVVSTYYGTQLDVWLDKIFPKPPSDLDQIINRFLNFVIRTITWTQISLADKLITQTNYCAKELNALYKKRASVIYWGSAPSHFVNSIIKSRNSGKIKLLSVSRIVPYKGFHYLIEIMNKLEKKYKLTLTIIGSHPNGKYLKYLRKIKNKNIKILVDVPDSVLSHYYKSSDIYITCDKFLFFGEPVLEAAHFGLPTVALNRASANEIIKHGKTGFVANNLNKFKNYLEYLINNKKVLRKFSNNARVSSRKFTWEKTAKSYRDLFKTAIQRN